MTETPKTPDSPETNAPAPEAEAKAKPVKGKVSITDTGQVMYQADATNPLPGVVVGALKKGGHVLDLNFEPADGVAFDGALLGDYINTILAPLAALAEVSDAPQPVQIIAAGLRDGLGIVRRADYTDQIKALDDNMRAILRSKGVRFGPLYIFCYDLNKPAAVRLRALLYALNAEMDLPAPVPADGMVSKAVQADEALRGFYMAIGYPVYGPRCIRIDMLDRVVNAVYESADKGQFKAQHCMAEWLGCGIADLYAVLEDLGHKKIYDPADEELKLQEGGLSSPAEAPAVNEGQSKDVVKTADAEEEKKPDAKPELATFTLKPGKAASRGGVKEADKPANKKSHRPKDKGKPKPKPKPKPKAKEHRVMSAEAAPPAAEDSPWAALAALKK